MYVYVYDMYMYIERSYRNKYHIKEMKWFEGFHKTEVPP